MFLKSELLDNCRKFQEQLNTEIAACGRETDKVQVLAVTKRRTIDEVRTVLGFGWNQIAENRIQEAEKKFQERPDNITLTFIGHLQSNKVRKAVKIFDQIHSVDSIKLAELIDKESKRIGKNIPICLEVNTSAESQKFGFTPKDVERSVDKIFEMQNLTLRGLMTVARFSNDEKLVRSNFAELRELFDRIKSRHPQQKEFTVLSMGMSNDYRWAIAEGSTMIRIGTALFGPRDS